MACPLHRHLGATRGSPLGERYAGGEGLEFAGSRTVTTRRHSTGLAARSDLTSGPRRAAGNGQLAGDRRRGRTERRFGASRDAIMGRSAASLGAPFASRGRHPLPDIGATSGPPGLCTFWDTFGVPMLAFQRSDNPPPTWPDNDYPQQLKLARKRVLVTGMSGVGKSSIAAALTARGYLAVDTDRDASRIAEGGERLWDKHEIDRLRSADQPNHSSSQTPRRIRRRSTVGARGHGWLRPSELDRRPRVRRCTDDLEHEIRRQADLGGQVVEGCTALGQQLGGP